MGLAASQARLLLLTARKSDLEYRAQCITNTEMILAMQTEAIARRYSEKISNQALFYNSNGTNVALESGNFLSTTANIGGYYLATPLRRADGSIDYVRYEVEKTAKTYTWTCPEGGANFLGNTYTAGQTVSVTEDQYKSLTTDEAAQCVVNPNTNEYTNEYTELELIQAINNGTLVIIGENDEPISLSGDTAFSECYYTDDDAAAEAEYKQATAAIQVKEKRLQNDLQQVESQQKACETEIDSVKKVIEKNIEKTFKVFS